ncbi:DoxX family protein [Candidatus Woesearchaeota archaeon]|nr:DoxX family protein [Candidatus Woesearchaeota archaeon]
MFGKEGECCVKTCCEKYSDWLFLVFRVVVGLMFAVHGAQKFGIIGNGSISGFAAAFGFPVWLAVVAGLVELVGGLFIALGLFTRIAAVFTSIMMIAALAIAHFPKGWNPFTNGGELALLYFAAFLVLVGYGGGKFSLTKLFCKNS